MPFQRFTFWSSLALLPLLGTLVTDLVAKPRGYQTTRDELKAIKEKADRGIEPHRSNVASLLQSAQATWNFSLNKFEDCQSADEPAWIDNGGGVAIVFAKALAFQLTDDARYAAEVKTILEKIMSEVHQISSTTRRCELVFSWGTPELVSSADLIEDYWAGMTCSGPTSTVYGENQIGTGPCKKLFQNWLVKNPYYVASLSDQGIGNWGTASAVATGYVADYLWDRPEVKLVHRNPEWKNGGVDFRFSPAEAYAHIKDYVIKSMNGYTVSYGSSRSCDLMTDSPDQVPTLGPPIKGQITETGIVPLDARRDEKCNITKYNGTYQNYPQLNLDNLTFYCELLLRRGDSSCYDNIDTVDIPSFRFTDKNGKTWTTHLKSGRGSLERGINAVIQDAKTEWKRTPGLSVAYRYYSRHKQLPQTDLSQWAQWLPSPGRVSCSQGGCYGELTHSLAPGETYTAPPIVAAPGAAVVVDNQVQQGTTPDLQLSSDSNTYPKIEEFTPKQGSVGSTVSIRGSNLSAIRSVRLGTRPVEKFTVVSNSEIRVVIPAGAQTGSFQLSDGSNFASAGLAFVVTTQQSAQTLKTIADARVSQQFPDKNYGDSDFLRLRLNDTASWRSYFKFDVRNAANGVSKATLRLFVTDGSEDAGSVYAVPSSWQEGEVNWLTGPSPSGPALEALGTVDANTWIDIDVTQAIKGNGIYSFVLMPNSNNSVLFSSKEGQHAPELVILGN